ncbi:unnamed protein product [Caenorhabditis bovis]|uniref:Uncharacterized protein n=1 Tax=Caenorhabditis bovis TaxID=2654633 RepID=A0A8S1F6G6_9PELO|nr:unnamed protein product [Caenorhabditis bovis]
MTIFAFIHRHSNCIAVLYSICLAMEQGFDEPSPWWQKFRDDILHDGKSSQKMEIILKMCIIGTTFVGLTAIVCFTLLTIRKMFYSFFDSKPELKQKPSGSNRNTQRKYSLVKSAINVSKKVIKASNRRRGKPSSKKLHLKGSNEDLEKKKKSVVLEDKAERARKRRDAIKQVDVHCKDVDEDDVGKFLAKVLSTRTVRKSTPPEEDKNADLKLDRLSRKKMTSALSRELSTGPNNNEKKPKKTSSKKRQFSGFSHELIEEPEITYGDVPKLEEIWKRPKENVYNPVTNLPYWMDVLEPSESDLEGKEMASAVCSEHIEQFRDKKIKLCKPADTRLELDTWQPLANLQSRDDIFFLEQQVFSNTVRSLIIVAKPYKNEDSKRNKINGSRETIKEPMKEIADSGRSTVRAGSREVHEDHVTFVLPEAGSYYSFTRDDPIVTAKAKKFVRLSQPEPAPPLVVTDSFAPASLTGPAPPR